MTKQTPNVIEAGSTKSSAFNLFLLPSETFTFCIVCFLDVAMTTGLLFRRDPGVQFVESNPIAAYFLNRWGIEGLAWFKAAMTAFVCVIVQVVARKNPAMAKMLLAVATLIVLTVVSYSVWLNFRHQ